MNNLLLFLVARFNYISFDNHSLNKSFELPLSVRTYAKQIRQSPSFDTNSDVSLQTLTSWSDVLVQTHHIGNSPPVLDPPPPLSLNQPMTSQTSISHSPQHYNTTDPYSSFCQFYHDPTCPLISNVSSSVNNSSSLVPTTQPQSHSSLPPFAHTFSYSTHHT